MAQYNAQHQAQAMFRAQAMHQAQAIQQAQAIKVSIFLIYMIMKGSSTHTFFIRTTQVNQSRGVGVEPNMSPGHSGIRSSRNRNES